MTVFIITKYCKQINIGITITNTTNQDSLNNLGTRSVLQGLYYRKHRLAGIFLDRGGPTSALFRIGVG